MTTEIRPPAAHQKPLGKLYLGVDQLDLVDNTPTLVLLDAMPASFTDGIEDRVNHKITPGVAGFYDVKGQAYLKDVVADKRYLLIIMLNAATPRVVACSQAAMAEYMSIAASALFYLSATDYLRLYVTSKAGADTVGIDAGERYTFLSIQRVR